MYLLPLPQQMSVTSGHFTIAYTSKIVIQTTGLDKVYQYGKLLKRDIETQLGYSLQITKGIHAIGDIVLQSDCSLAEEEYTLKITEEGIFITGGNEKGILHGIQTLRQMIANSAVVLPISEIKDYPAIANRGFYHDVTRGRIPTLESLKQLADKLSYYKLNQLQLYIEHSYLFQDFSEIWRDDTPLTAEEIMELDAYCNQLNIELVPSLSTFGHLYKALESKTYGYLCECPEATMNEFSFDDRMAHHTLDISNDESILFSKKLISEFLPLFSSNQFNICADETFDLGKGKSKPLAEKIGIQGMYINYVKSICEYVIEQGKRPMFWGDVIAGFPEAIKQLPKEVICLNWGYAPLQTADETRLLYQAGAVQYVCPGVGGWNQFINLLKSSYNNITRMCSYAHKFKAIGVLNTDWGDYGHINHPEFSTAGIIYGAAFSWNEQEIDFDDINKQISLLEYGDHSETFVDMIDQAASQMVFDWREVIRFKESAETEFAKAERIEKIPTANANLKEIIAKLYTNITNMDKEKRSLLKAYLVAIDGMIAFNEIGAVISKVQFGIDSEITKNPTALAVELEYWFHEYKGIWRTTSKESELYRIQEVIIWYADYLRELEKKSM